MKFKRIVCPCCGKEADIPLGEYSAGFDFNYSTIINSVKEFFDLVDVCPNCGYAMLFDNSVSNDTRAYIQSEEYRNIVENNNIERGLKNWILLAMVLEQDDNFTEAGIAYGKAYDYLALKSMPLDKRLIEKSASCHLSAADEYTSFADALLAVDAMRRDGEFEQAKHFLDVTCSTFSGELVDKLSWKEKMWIDLRETEKRYLDI